MTGDAKWQGQEVELPDFSQLYLADCADRHGIDDLLGEPGVEHALQHDQHPTIAVAVIDAAHAWLDLCQVDLADADRPIIDGLYHYALDTLAARSGSIAIAVALTMQHIHCHHPHNPIAEDCEPIPLAEDLRHPDPEDNQQQQLMTARIHVVMQNIVDRFGEPGVKDAYGRTYPPEIDEQIRAAAHSWQENIDADPDSATADAAHASHLAHLHQLTLATGSEDIAIVLTLRHIQRHHLHQPHWHTCGAESATHAA